MNLPVKRLLAALTGMIAIAAFVMAIALLNTQTAHPQISDPPPDSYPAPGKTASFPSSGEVTLHARTKDSYFYLAKDGEWHGTFLKGVNMGLTLPTTDLEDPDIPYEVYREWLDAIAAMNANTVRVFTIMNPDFYRAFADYNAQNTARPLYLLQGVWFNETWMESIGDAFGEDGQILNSLIRGAREAVDIVHGNSDYTSYGSIQKAVYDRDISRYVIGFILGLEWLPEFVITTNQNNAGMAQYTGEYLYTQNAAPFEVFLARAGDALIQYETQTYQQQRPVSFLNWTTTDTLTHSNEPFPEEDMVAVDTQTVRSTAAYHAGLFAAVDVYPYYPEFLNHQPEYLSFSDPSTGKPNPYRAYLRELRSEYDVPVLIAEFGVPTSRGVAHIGAMGYNQGGMEETQQGNMVVAMAQDIAREGYAGGMVFSWQDEWFKQTWNTIPYAPANPSQRGLNVESAEQRYGILAYEPDSEGYPDGDLSEWEEASPVWQDSPKRASPNWEGMSLFAKADEGYLSLLLRLSAGQVWSNHPVAIPLSLTGRGSEHASAHSLSFDRPVDFLLVIDGETNTRLLTDAYVDRFYYQTSIQRSVFPRNPTYEKQNSGVFQPIRTLISNEMVLPLTGKTIPPQSYESGLLRFGNANPAHSDYHSLADFYAKGRDVELRIPWYLLNVLNGPEKTILGAFYKGDFYKGIAFEKAEQIYIGAVMLEENSSPPQRVVLSPFSWQEIPQSSYRPRLKQSYSIIREGFARLMPDYR